MHNNKRQGDFTGASGAAGPVLLMSPGPELQADGQMASAIAPDTFSITTGQEVLVAPFGS
jgi:hypothetical protein